MKLYYTVSAGYDLPSTRPSNSIGGYQSSTMVQNDVYSAVFGEISLLAESKGSDEYIGLMLVNDSDTDLNNLKFWFKDVEPPTQSVLEFAAVKPAIDENGNAFIERLATINSRPQNITFSHPTEDSPANLGDMLAGVSIGVWLHRKIDKDAAKEIYDNVAMRDPKNWYRYIPVKQAEFEGAELNFVWD